NWPRYFLHRSKRAKPDQKSTRALFSASLSASATRCFSTESEQSGRSLRMRELDLAELAVCGPAATARVSPNVIERPRRKSFQNTLLHQSFALVYFYHFLSKLAQLAFLNNSLAEFCSASPSPFICSVEEITSLSRGH
ncbi:hypothetical protein, partial [Ruegeria sp. HKCCA4812]|uniref:hypothetical protein n=1 Tax=Ruegeria sp. HKCCA4812 TaxID=2682993 RepID=UPI001C2BCD9D